MNSDADIALLGLATHLWGHQAPSAIEGSPDLKEAWARFAEPESSGPVFAAVRSHKELRHIRSSLLSAPEYGFIVLAQGDGPAGGVRFTATMSRLKVEAKLKGLKLMSWSLLPGPSDTVLVMPDDNAKAFRSGMTVYTPQRFAARLGAAALSALGPLKTHRLVASGYMVAAVNKKLHAHALLREQTYYAAKTGLSGPYSKVSLLQIDGTGEVQLFTKVGTGSHSARSIALEAKALRAVQNIHLRSVRVPRVIEEKTDVEPAFLSMEAFPNHGQQQWKDPPPRLTAFLRELARDTLNPDAEENQRWLRSVERRLTSMPLWARQACGTQSEALLAHVLRQLGDNAIPFWSAHGDCTPWNLFLSDKELVLSDWEFYRPSSPALYDYFHFYCQNAILVERLEPHALLSMLRDKAASGKADMDLSAEIPVDLLIATYLLETISFYMELYALQKPRFEQVDWLVEAWRGLAEELVGTS
jgi:hypothetical protein